MVEPNQVHGSIGPAAPETLGSRVLELSSILQTTLEIEQQIALFSKALTHHLDIDGLDYRNPDIEQLYKAGSLTSLRATYDLRHEGSDLGTIRFYRELPLTGRELKLLENLLCSLVYPLRNALTYQAALRLASHDPLTGVQNRLALDTALQREVDLAHRQAAPLSMLVIDADYFKHFNDQYGHSFGDDVLRTLANTASSTVRRSDLLYRYGGEEFVVLAAHTNREGAALLAERIREAISNIHTIRGRNVSLTVSIGVAQLGSDEDAMTFFERTDEAMYDAKKAGRNRVAVG